MVLTSRHTLNDAATASGEALAARYETDLNAGLTATEAEKRLQQYGMNSIHTAKRKNQLLQLLAHFKSPLVLILLAATVISYSLGEAINASIILFIVVISVLIDFFQERDASEAVEKLKATVKNRVVVIRDNKEQEIIPEHLCIGDMVLLNAGKIVPADVRIIAAKTSLSTSHR